MPGWLLMVLGVVAGLLLIGGVIWFSFRSEGRQRRGKSWLAKRSGRDGGMGQPTDLLGE